MTDDYTVDDAAEDRLKLLARLPAGQVRVTALPETITAPDTATARLRVAGIDGPIDRMVIYRDSDGDWGAAVEIDSGQVHNTRPASTIDELIDLLADDLPRVAAAYRDRADRLQAVAESIEVREGEG